MIFVIDNYDSFTYNLVQYLGEEGADLQVKRNDEISPGDVVDLAPHGIVLSPGPCTPNEAGICLDLIRQASDRQIPMLGVCLGHQAMGQAFGGEVVRAKRIMHGKVSKVSHDAKGVFAGLASPLTVTRYHSLSVAEDSWPDCLEITARAEDDGEIMGLRHKELPIEGVQFHPESILSEHGKQMVRNWLQSLPE